MRIVGGDFRGRPLQSPPGEQTRPTADRARQAVFNILEHARWSEGLEGRRVLDVFAGSGALGLEALSRGAAQALFIDKAEPALAVVRANVATLGVGARARLLKADATRLSKRLESEAPFDLALIDPPYGKGLGEMALASLRGEGWLAPDALVALERGAGEPPLTAPGFEVLDERRYGAARVWFLRPVTD
jgi:16S rRNA (guanine966-N2)-methyltransferase